MLVVGCLTGVLVTLAQASTAQATSFKLACLIHGSGTASPPVQLTSSVGDFEWNTPATITTVLCAGLEKGSPVLVQMALSSTGLYVNPVCGTGSVTSSQHDTQALFVNVIAPTGGAKVDYAAIVDSLEYEIDLVGGQGTITGTTPKLPVSISGVVSVTGNELPPNPPPNGSDCVRGFDFTAALVVDPIDF